MGKQRLDYNIANLNNWLKTNNYGYCRIVSYNDYSEIWVYTTSETYNSVMEYMNTLDYCEYDRELSFNNIPAYDDDDVILAYKYQKLTESQIKILEKRIESRARQIMEYKLEIAELTDRINKAKEYAKLDETTSEEPLDGE